MSIEDVLISISEQVGGLHIKSASRMNRALVIFLKEVSMVDELLEKGLVVNDTFLPILPLSNPSKAWLLSNVPPFIKERTLKEILERYGKLTAPIKMILLGLKNPNFKHVMSFRRFTYMIPNSQNEPLNLVLKIAVEGKDYTIFITSDNIQSFLCGEHGHQKQTCPKQQSGNILAGLQTTPKKIFRRIMRALKKIKRTLMKTMRALKKITRTFRKSMRALKKITRTFWKTMRALKKITRTFWKIMRPFTK
ncbi:hypothetical protein PO909_029016 [Leuciscus waleckii]